MRSCPRASGQRARWLVGARAGDRSACRPEHRHLHRASCGGISRGDDVLVKRTHRTLVAHIPSAPGRAAQDAQSCRGSPPPRTATPEDASAPEPGWPKGCPGRQYSSRALEAVWGDLLSSQVANHRQAATIGGSQPLSGRNHRQVATVVRRPSRRGGQCERKDGGNPGVPHELRRHRHRPARVHAIVDQQDRTVHREQPFRQLSVHGQLLPHLRQA